MLQDCGATPSSGPPGSSKLPWFWRRSALIVWDAFAWVLALTVPVIIRYDLQLNQSQWRWIALYTASAITLQAVGGLWSHFYLGRHRVGSFAEATWLGVLVVAIGGVLGAVFGSFIPHFPRGVALILPPTALVLMAAGRWALRAFFLDRRRRPTKPDALRALVYGAGDAGHEVARLVDTATEPPYLIVGFLDDDPDKRYLRIRGHRIFGTGEDLVATAQATAAEVVILAISDASPELIKTIADGCEDAGVKLIVVPPVREMIGGRVTLGSLREFNVADLLGRRPIHTDLSQISDYVNGKVVLVTGAGGSIGSELARQVQMLGPEKLILLDRDESALHGVQLSLYGSGLLDTDDLVLCSIRDYEALQAIFDEHKPEVVFHAAALKHLPMLQRFPVEGWKTNVLGTLNVLRCAHEVGVRNFVNISTDKAADASSVLGQTKRLAERLTAWYANRYELPYLSVRFGNVLGSRGSVVHAFKAQIEQGGPVTVTHPDVTRYFMTIPEACELVLQAGAIGRPGDVLVLDMGQPVKIIDVAERLIAESGRDDIKVKFTGLRPGEKLHEVLFSEVEHGSPSQHPLISGVLVPDLDPDSLAANLHTTSQVRAALDWYCDEAAQEVLV